MKLKSKNLRSFGPEKFTASAIIKGYASYTAFKRDYALDLKYAWEAYKEAIHHSKNWISEYKKEDEYSAVIYRPRDIAAAWRRTYKIPYRQGSKITFIFLTRPCFVLFRTARNYIRYFF